MKLRPHHYVSARERGSVFVIVLLISLGLISIALYFANSMTLELRAADNRTSGLAADQAIEGAARYVSSILTMYATNGAVPDLTLYEAEAVPVGNSLKPEENAHFWLIGREPGGASTSNPYFGLVDETAKLDLNTEWLSGDRLGTNLASMTVDFAAAIADWRDTNSTDASLNYSQSGYLAKHSPFETVGELRLVYGSTMELLAGEDINRNGLLDANEQDANGNGEADPGAMEYFTVYSRQPNTHSDGTLLTNVNQAQDLRPLLEARLGNTRAQGIMGTLFATNAPGAAVSLLQFYLRSGMTSDEFALIYNDIATSTNAPYVTGRVNINTASAAVLACIPGLDPNVAQQLVSYRESNPSRLTSIAWIVDALGANNQNLQNLAQGDYITTHSYQFTADIAAVGPFGRGYRRVRFVFDLSDGTPKIIYRQDLSRLGWALGKPTRETWVAQNSR